MVSSGLAPDKMKIYIHPDLLVNINTLFAYFKYFKILLIFPVLTVIYFRQHIFSNIFFFNKFLAAQVFDHFL